MESLNLLEERLQRLEYILGWNDARSHSSKKEDLAVPERLVGLEKQLRELTAQSEIAADLLRIRSTI